MPTVRIDDKRWREMEKTAVKATIKHQVPISTPDVLKALIDLHLKDMDIEEIIDAKKESKSK